MARLTITREDTPLGPYIARRRLVLTGKRTLIVQPGEVFSFDGDELGIDRFALLQSGAIAPYLKPLPGGAA